MSDSPWYPLWHKVAIAILEGADYYNLKEGVPDHVRRRLDSIKTAPDQADALKIAARALDSMWLWCLNRGQASTKGYYLARASEAEGRAKGYSKRGWDEAAETHLKKAEEFRKLAETAQEKGNDPLRRAMTALGV